MPINQYLMNHLHKKNRAKVNAFALGRGTVGAVGQNGLVSGKFHELHKRAKKIRIPLIFP
jgi:hypothetical protein